MKVCGVPMAACGRATPIEIVDRTPDKSLDTVAKLKLDRVILTNTQISSISK